MTDETLIFDMEGTTKNKGNAFTKTNYMCSVAWGYSTSDQIDFSYYRDPDFLDNIRLELHRCKRIVGVNIKFDIHWMRRYGVEIPDHVEIWDCSIAEHIMSGQKSVLPSMDKMCEQYGITGKEGGLHEYWDNGIDTPDIPLHVLQAYNIGDISRTKALYQAQLKDERLQKTPNLEKLILLDGEDLRVLEDMEFNGIKYDIDGSRKLGTELRVELDDINKYLVDLAGSPLINFDSGDQLSAFLFGGDFTIDEKAEQERVYKTGDRKGQRYTVNATVATHKFDYPGFFNPIPGTEVKKSTDTKKVYSVSDEVLKQLKGRSKVQRSIIERLQRRAKLSKLVDTYLFPFPELIEKMEWGEYLHGQFNQTIAATGRLSSSKPNLQNTDENVDGMLITRF